MFTDADGKQWLTGDGSYGFKAEIDGEDLVIKNVFSTYFGGNSDPMDNGLTASGIPTRDNPKLMGCALPLPHTPRTHGSPLPPRIPFGTIVHVYCHSTQKSCDVKFIDIGPAKPPFAHAGIDLTIAAFKAIAPHGSLALGRIMVDYRILKGAMFLLTLHDEVVTHPLTAEAETPAEEKAEGAAG